MQISRKILVACAAACATTLAARGTDTPAQIKAREAMRQQLQNNQGQAPAPTPAAPAVINRADSDSISKAREALHQQLQSAPAPVSAPTPAPAVPPQPAAAPIAPAPVAAPAAAANTDTPVPPAAPPAQKADPEAIVKAREAVRQRIEESAATPPPVASTPATPTPAPAPAPASGPERVVTVPPTSAPAAAPVESTQPAAAQASDSEAIAKARSALRQQMNENFEPGPKADNDSIAKAREAVRQRMDSITYADPTSRAGNKPGTNFPPLEGPPLPISSDKQQRLYELLQRYKADQVTPEQYQAERAKILAGQ
ncbi:MAG TPA: hypothetical protein VKY92_17820 [Verrucomicrobiae bacterium]|nr:hypothetical protein [Verrucomicrobiae bacterium]